MTKVEMVEAIQVAEAKAWKEYQESNKLWGSENSLTRRLRMGWVTIYDLRESMGIEGLKVERLLELDLVA